MELTLLTDYRSIFGSKWDAIPYRSGMDKKLLEKYFNEVGFNIQYKSLSELNFNNVQNDIFGKYFLYTSAEDKDLVYKNFIEDIILALELMGAKAIPNYYYLRSNNNKVFMELLRKYLFDRDLPASSVFGCFEDMKVESINYPVVIKLAAGAMSSGVRLVHDWDELVELLKSKYNSRGFIYKLKELVRVKKHKGYIRETYSSSKFISQEFIPGLKSDYKILIYGDKYYVFERPVRENDFRASGSGHKHYIYGSDVKLPEGILDFAVSVFTQMDTPHLSIDIAFDGKRFFLIEFQALYFGTVGHVKSNGYYRKSGEKWVFNREKLPIEKVYVDSIVCYLAK